MLITLLKIFFSVNSLNMNESDSEQPSQIENNELNQLLI